MVQYSNLKFFKGAKARNRTIDRLLELRAGLVKDVTPKDKQQSFHLATWNIRDFGAHRSTRRPRLAGVPALYRRRSFPSFDLIAVQEVNEDMTEFEKVMRMLGPRWNYVVTDQSGNHERLAFVFDTRKIRFRHVTGEIVLPPKGKGDPIQPHAVPRRVPGRLAQVQHLHRAHSLRRPRRTPPRATRDRRHRRVLHERQKKDGETYILIGDFNILSPDHPTMASLLERRLQSRAAVEKTDRPRRRAATTIRSPLRRGTRRSQIKTPALPLAELRVPRRCRL